MGVESFGHKLAKELLFSQIREKGEFPYKGKGLGFVPQVGPDSVLSMEFPTAGGLMPDEVACTHFNQAGNRPCDNHTSGRVKDSGYSKCHSCGLLDLSKVVIHDIACLHKGNVIWAIEIVQGHTPVWIDRLKPHYPVFLVRVESVLNRVVDSPVFVDGILG